MQKITSSNSNDLKEKLIESYSSSENAEYHDLILSKTIFDQGDFATLKVTLLQSANQELNISSLGKIANIKGLEITRVEKELQKATAFWFWIIGGYFSLILSMIGIVYILEELETRTKTRKIGRFQEKHGAFSEDQQEIASLYLGFGSRITALIIGLLANDFVLDFKEIIKEQLPPGAAVLTLPYLSISLPRHRRIQFQSLPRAIFNVEGTIISFNSENSVFIKSFFREVL
jgi:hypothetical protein